MYCMLEKQLQKLKSNEKRIESYKQKKLDNYKWKKI